MNIKYWTLNTEQWTLNTEHWTLNIEQHWTLNIQCSLNIITFSDVIDWKKTKTCLFNVYFTLCANAKELFKFMGHWNRWENVAVLFHKQKQSHDKRSTAASFSIIAKVTRIRSGSCAQWFASYSVPYPAAEERRSTTAHPRQARQWSRNFVAAAAVSVHCGGAQPCEGGAPQTPVVMVR